MKTSLTETIEAIANDVLILAQAVLDENELDNSSLRDKVKVQIKSMNEPIVVEVLFDNYIDYIERGRKPNSGGKPPIDALRNWALVRNIPADNSTLWAISTAIQRDGYEGRPIIASLEEQIENYFEREWADKLFDATTEELTKYFD